MPIRTIIAPEDVRKVCSEWRIERQTIAFVPTMGALHEGHLSLVKEAKASCDRVIMSIFVNPLQFGPKEDFASYPRMFQKDIAQIEPFGVDALFVPNAADMYPDGYQTYVTNDARSDILCGRFRPGHFQGVLTVVAKLFHLVQPHVALFGKKDYQQYQLIRKMADDLMFGIDVRGCPTLRDPDGLAMSSRNLRLTPEERRKAPYLFTRMQELKQRLERGENRAARLLQTFTADLAKEPSFRLEYAEIRSARDLGELGETIEEPAVLLVAAHLGSVRLIDNLELSTS